MYPFVEVCRVFDGRQLLGLHLVDFGRTFEITDGNLFQDVMGVSSSQSTFSVADGKYPDRIIQVPTSS